MHGPAVAGYKKITIRNHCSKIDRRGFEDLSNSRVQSIAVEPNHISLFRPEERDNIYPLPVKSGNEFTKIFDRPPFAPRLPAPNENPNGRSLTAPASQLLYSPSSSFVLRIGKTQ